MPPRYTVRAHVIDIRTDMPRSTDAFLVDTNVWCWYSYRNTTMSPGGPSPVQASAYSGYVRQAASLGATCYRTGLSLAELAHLIEQNEVLETVLET